MVAAPVIVGIPSKNSRYYNIIHQQPDIIIRQYGDVISQYQINVEMIICLHLRYGFVCILFVYTKLHDLVQIKSPGVSQVLISGIALNKSCTDDTCWYSYSSYSQEGNNYSHCLSKDGYGIDISVTDCKYCTY